MNIFEMNFFQNEIFRFLSKKIRYDKVDDFSFVGAWIGFGGNSACVVGYHVDLFEVFPFFGQLRSVWNLCTCVGGAFVAYSCVWIFHRSL